MPSNPTHDAILRCVRDYMSTRDGMRAKHIAFGDVNNMEFIRAINAIARRLVANMPEMSDEEFIGFTELVYTWASELRRREVVEGGGLTVNANAAEHGVVNVDRKVTELDDAHKGMF